MTTEKRHTQSSWGNQDRRVDGPYVLHSCSTIVRSCTNWQYPNCGPTGEYIPWPATGPVGKLCPLPKYIDPDLIEEDQSL
jgi:hypothetical protein